MVEKACTKCHLILEDVDQCPVCGPEVKLTARWNGYIIIINPEKSEIAKRIGAKVPGRYAQRLKK